MSWAAGRRRSVRRTVSFTREEWAAACRVWHAGDAGARTFGEHARRMLTRGRVVSVTLPADAADVSRLVLRLGVNANQVARLCNGRGTASREDAQRIARLLAQVRDLLGELCQAVERIESGQAAGLVENAGEPAAGGTDDGEEKAWR